MCGIAGIIGDYGVEESGAILRNMIAALDHRGPDDSGIFQGSCAGKSIALGHTRLSILDLSAAGRQPMVAEANRCSISFNGEIYNFRDLRKLLDPDNTLIRTRTDTEVILLAYQRWSTACFENLRGMFALSLLDTEQRILHLVRDPSGIKPLYYFRNGANLFFASEVRALLATGQVPRRINPRTLAHFAAFGSAGPSETMIEGIMSLVPGQRLTFDLSKEDLPMTSAVADPFTAIDSAPEKNRDECTAHLAHLLRESARMNLVSDVPVGLFLSGGIDSSVLLHLLHETGWKDPRTFTVILPDKHLDEGTYAKRIAHHYHAYHTELPLSDSDLLAQLPGALSSMDQPTIDGINTYTIAKAVHSAGIKVALTGLGADELFAGYASFARARWGRSARRVPLRIRKTIARCGRQITRSSSGEKLWDLVESDCSPASAYLISRRLFGAEDIHSLFGKGLPFESPKVCMTGGDEVNEVSRMEFNGYMTNLLLRDADFMSMAHSLELRVHVLQLPGRWKIGRRPKALLLDAMRGAIPAYVWRRKKMGFVFPLDRWMRSILAPEIRETFSNRRLTLAAGLKASVVEDVWTRFQSSQVKASQPWSLFVLLRWCEQHRVSL
jgi:asparagine synthase (glutamine-hydrolysing)